MSEPCESIPDKEVLLKFVQWTTEKILVVHDTIYVINQRFFNDILIGTIFAGSYQNKKKSYCVSWNKRMITTGCWRSTMISSTSAASFRYSVASATEVC